MKKNKPNKKVRTQIMLTTALKYQVNAYAKHQQISFSAAVRQLLNKAFSVQTRCQQPDPSDLLLTLSDSAVSLPGKKAPKDLSTNDDYLYGEDAL